MKFKFESQFIGFGSPKTTMEFDVDQLEDVLMYFKQFLQGSGYAIDGDIDVVNWEKDELGRDIDMDGRC